MPSITPITPAFDVIGQILQYTEQEGDWMMHLGIRLQVIGGLRFNELVDIRWRDLIIIGEKRVKNTVVAKISKQNCGKFAIGEDVKIKRKVKKFPIDHNTAKVLLHYWDRKRRPPGDHFVFCASVRRTFEQNIGLRKLVYSTYRRRLKRICEAIGFSAESIEGVITTVTTHSIRKAAAVFAMQAITEETRGNLGYAIQAVSRDMLGHKNISSTYHYLNLGGTVREAQMRMMGLLPNINLSLQDDIPDDLLSKRGKQVKLAALETRKAEWNENGDLVTPGGIIIDTKKRR